MLEEQDVTVSGESLEDLIEQGYPFFPFVIPLVPLLLLGGAVWILWRYLDRMTTSIERQEALLQKLVTGVDRLG